MSSVDGDAKAVREPSDVRSGLIKYYSTGSGRFDADGRLRLQGDFSRGRGEGTSSREAHGWEGRCCPRHRPATASRLLCAPAVVHDRAWRLSYRGNDARNGEKRSVWGLPTVNGGTEPGGGQRGTSFFWKEKENETFDLQREEGELDQGQAERDVNDALGTERAGLMEK